MANVGFKTDRGRLRGNNEDALLVLPRMKIYAVADGVGGHNSGEVASRKAVTGLEKYIEEHSMEACYESEDIKSGLISYFLDFLVKANKEIIEYSARKPENSGMATTFVAAHIHLEKLYVVNIGDSRAYIVRDGKISQVTVDHTVVNQMIADGDLSVEEARVHPRKNEITRALGAEENVVPDFFISEIMPGDRVLLCTDGLYGELSDSDICDTVSLGDDLNDICRSLVAKANARGGRDNVTVICVEI